MTRSDGGTRYRPAFFRMVSILFFLSGFGGLGYQIIWLKRFSHLWGNSTLAMAAVVASFLTTGESPGPNPGVSAQLYNS